MDMLREVPVNSLGIHVVSPEEEKEGYGGKNLQKRKVLCLEWKSEGWWNRPTNNNKYESQQHTDRIRFFFKTLITVITFNDSYGSSAVSWRAVFNDLL